MKILIVSQYWAPENNIPSRRWEWLSGLLADEGHEVTVIAPPPHYLRKISMREWGSTAFTRKQTVAEVGDSQERIFRSAFFPAGSALTQRVLNQAVVALGSLATMLRRPDGLRGYAPDLIIGTVPAIPTAMVVELIARQLKVPYLIDLRDAWPDLLEDADGWNKSIGEVSLREKLLRRGPLQVVSVVTRKLINKALRNAAAITVTSSYLADDLAKRPEVQNHGSPLTIRTIRNVFPMMSVYQRAERTLERRKSLNVLYAGTLGRAQNLQNAIEAAAIARERGLLVNLKMVGAGVAKEALVEFAKQRNVSVEFEARHQATDLYECYAWADTALVHLTDWESLQRAVPSKTYELMEAGIHISGVVQGECADLITRLNAGDVVPPEDPNALADLWKKLLDEPERLKIGDKSRRWVIDQREVVAPDTLREIIDLSRDRTSLKR